MNSLDTQKLLDEVAELRATTKSLESRVKKLEDQRLKDLGVVSREW